MIAMIPIVDTEIEKLRRDSPDIKAVKFSETTVANKPAYKLFFIDGIYRQVIIWIKSDEVLCEISYSARDQYSKHLPVVEKMIESFRFIDKCEIVSNQTQLGQTNSSPEEPILTLKRRFANGEISEAEYQRMRKILER